MRNSESALAVNFLAVEASASFADRILDLFAEFHTRKQGGVGIDPAVGCDICQIHRRNLITANNANGREGALHFTLPAINFRGVNPYDVKLRGSSGHF